MRFGNFANQPLSSLPSHRRPVCPSSACRARLLFSPTNRWASAAPSARPRVLPVSSSALLTARDSRRTGHPVCTVGLSEGLCVCGPLWCSLRVFAHTYLGAGVGCPLQGFPASSACQLPQKVSRVSACPGYGRAGC
ncbi:hypothetical protein HJG60_008390 [Phyllostomus discolor]|uniref:Uncharacterized protein n=1 Tax=Phyllostomus discolor TaxID=89673 RepID=A0A833Z2W4_9CHIR|nr:hypothetical protein HJG60_008390 [Phyllostomus discolor]